jgi:hypothetical protein
VAKFTQSEKALVEHYIYATAASAAIIWERGGTANHNLKHVLFAAIFGVVGPVLAKINPKGVVADLTKKEHLSAPEAAVLDSVATTAVADASAALAKAAK